MSFKLEPLRVTWGPSEVAAYLGISRRELGRLMAAGAFSPPIGGLTTGARRRLWIAADVQEWLKARAGKDGRPPARDPPRREGGRLLAPGRPFVRLGAAPWG